MPCLPDNGERQECDRSAVPSSRRDRAYPVPPCHACIPPGHRRGPDRRFVVGPGALDRLPCRLSRELVHPLPDLRVPPCRRPILRLLPQVDRSLSPVSRSALGCPDERYRQIVGDYSDGRTDHRCPAYARRQSERDAYACSSGRGHFSHEHDILSRLPAAGCLHPWPADHGLPQAKEPVRPIACSRPSSFFVRVILPCGEQSPSASGNRPFTEV